MNHLNEKRKYAIQVSATVTRSGKYFQEITRPDNVDPQGVIFDEDSPKAMGKTQTKEVEGKTM